jgi:tRNA threonylcarbamoyl adenosine modification protein YeaZ
MILAIDTATRAIGVALATQTGVVAAAGWTSENNHTIELAPTVARLLAETQSLPTLKAIAVVSGPGSFTGVRIGLAFAKGLALARNWPLIGVSAFEVAVRALSPEVGAALAIVAAGRGRVIVGECRVVAGQWMTESEGRVVAWAEAVQQASGRWLVGEIDPVGERLLQGSGIQYLAAPRSARHLAEIGWERLRAGAFTSGAALQPIYA